MEPGPGDRGHRRPVATEGWYGGRDGGSGGSQATEVTKEAAMTEGHGEAWLLWVAW